jgi:hypothetical protein
MRRNHARDTEDEHDQRSGTPPMLPESAGAMAPLKPGPKEAKQYKPRGQHEVNALHAESLPLALANCPV